MKYEEKQTAYHIKYLLKLLDLFIRETRTEIEKLYDKIKPCTEQKYLLFYGCECKRSPISICVVEDIETRTKKRPIFECIYCKKDVLKK